MKKMTVKKKIKEDFISDGVDEILNDFYKIGLIRDVTMREYKALDLPEPQKYTAKDIIKIRKELQVSQSVFAKLLNSSPSTIQKWEIGAKAPSGFANKLLYIAEKKGIEGLV